MKPHIYRWQGRWWVTYNGPRNWQRGITLNDRDYPSFRLACGLACALSETTWLSRKWLP